MFLNIVDFGILPQISVEAPRAATMNFPTSFWPHRYDPGRTFAEARICRESGDAMRGRGYRLEEVPVVLVVTVVLAEVASMDKDLNRVGLVTGGSVYPLAWNILLAARNEGLGGVLTTLVVPEEDAVRELLGLPATNAVAALIPLGHPVQQLTRLRRRLPPSSMTEAAKVASSAPGHLRSRI